MYFEHFKSCKDYEKLKAFFNDATKGRYFLARPDGLNEYVIFRAFKNEDPETVIEAYLDVLDYKKEIKFKKTLYQVLESMSYDESIDHVLFNHVQAEVK